jgi:hypothetical protein
MRMPHWRINRTRDLRLVHRVLLASDRARWLGDPAPTTAAPPLDDLARAVDRVRALCGTARREVASSETAATIAPLALVGDALPVWRVEDGRETA